MKPYSYQGHLLLEFIERTGASISDFAKKADISRNTVYNIITGRCYPSIQIAHKIALTLDINRDEFMTIFFPVTDIELSKRKLKHHHKN